MMPLLLLMKPYGAINESIGWLDSNLLDSTIRPHIQLKGANRLKGCNLLSLIPSISRRLTPTIIYSIDSF